MSERRIARRGWRSRAALAAVLAAASLAGCVVAGRQVAPVAAAPLPAAPAGAVQPAGRGAAPGAAQPADGAAPRFLDRRAFGERGPPFSEAVRHGDTLYLSGQIGSRPGSMQLVPGGMVPEARQALANIRDVLQAYGLDLGDDVKCTVMLAVMNEWGAFNEVYREFFVAPFPARSALGASGLALGARVEIECLAAIGR